jgi:hypothetical protein
MSPGANTNSTKGISANADECTVHPVTLLGIAPIQDRGHQDAGNCKEQKLKSVLQKPGAHHTGRLLHQCINLICRNQVEDTPKNIKHGADPGQSSIPRHTILLIA